MIDSDAYFRWVSMAGDEIGALQGVFAVNQKITLRLRRTYALGERMGQYRIVTL